MSFGRNHHLEAASNATYANTTNLFERNFAAKNVPFISVICILLVAIFAWWSDPLKTSIGHGHGMKLSETGMVKWNPSYLNMMWHFWGHLGPPLFGTPSESSSVCRSVADQVGAALTVMKAGRSTNNSLQDTID